MHSAPSMYTCKPMFSQRGSARCYLAHPAYHFMNRLLLHGLVSHASDACRLHLILNLATTSNAPQPRLASTTTVHWHLIQCKGRCALNASSGRHDHLRMRWRPRQSSRKQKHDDTIKCTRGADQWFAKNFNLYLNLNMQFNYNTNFSIFTIAKFRLAAMVEPANEFYLIFLKYI